MLLRWWCGWHLLRRLSGDALHRSNGGLQCCLLHWLLPLLKLLLRGRQHSAVVSGSKACRRLGSLVIVLPPCCRPCWPLPRSC